MEFNYQKLTSDSISLVENKQFAVDCKINELLEENISKILCLDASSKVDGYEVNNKEVVVRGKINYKLVYEDINKEIRSLNYLSDYEDTLLSNDITSTDKIFVESGVSNVSSSGIDIVRLNAVVNIKIYKVTSKESESIVNNLENCYYKTENILRSDFVTTVASSFDLEEETTLNDTIIDILMLDSAISLDNAICNDNKITLEGTSVVAVTYRTNKGVFVQKFDIPFSEEVEGACSTFSTCYSKLSIDSTKVVLLDEDKTIRVKLAVDNRSIVFNKTEAVVVNDMYSMTDELNIKKENITVENFDCYKSFSDRVAVEATLKDNLNGKIIGVICPKNTVASARVKEGILTIEGVVSATLIYENETVCSLLIEAPYKVETECDYKKISVSGIVQDISAKSLKDNAILLDSALKFCIKCFDVNNMQVVTFAEENGKIKQNNSAISIIVIDSKKTFFDVAKSLSTTPEELAKQNPTLVEPLSLGDKLYYYRKLTKSKEAE